MGVEVGLALDEECLVPIEIDYEDWLARGSAGQSASPLIDRLLAERPGGTESFRVSDGPEGRRLHQRYWLGRWRRPA